jgi:hypothetical protein
VVFYRGDLNYLFAHRWQVCRDAAGNDYVPCEVGRIVRDVGDWLVWAGPPGELSDRLSKLEFVRVRSHGPEGSRIAFQLHRVHDLIRGGVTPLPKVG